MTDPKKMAAMALEVLPPPDRLKRKPPAGPDDAPPDEEEGGNSAGVLAMGDVRKALDAGDDKAAFAALERAVEACNSGGYEGD